MIPDLIVVLALCVLAFTATFLFDHWLLGSGARLATMDHPNRRSLHEVPTITGGGIAIAVSVLGFGGVLSLVFPVAGLHWIGLATALVAGISVIDDYRPLSPMLRLAVHAAAACVLVIGGFVPVSLGLPDASVVLPRWLGTGFCLLYAIWMINLYNFMDGMDGFAGGMSVIGFSTFALLGLLAGDLTFFGTSLIIAAAGGGFLVFNLPPARIFMGDVGASSLGLLAAALTLWAHRDGIFPIWVGVLVFSPFVVDATVTLVSRVARGRRIWQAHRTHFYQRLVRLGWGHQRTVYWEYGLMIACGGSAVVALDLASFAQWMLLSGWAVAYTLLMLGVSRLESAS